MNFDSKSYLLAYLETIETGKKADYIFKMLGDFKLKPGSLKLIDSKCDKYISGKVDFTNQLLHCTSLSIGNGFDGYGIDIEGTLEDSNTYLRIYNYHYIEESLIITLVTNKGDKPGIYVFDFNVRAGYDGKYYPGVAFYDEEALKSLIGDYDLSKESITKLDFYSLLNKGFKPDEVALFKLKDFGFNHTYDFVNYILIGAGIQNIMDIAKTAIKENEELVKDGYTFYKR